MDRRTFVSTLCASGVLASVAGATDASGSASRSSVEPRGTVDDLEFDTTKSLLSADGEPLTEDDLVAVWAEDTANNEDGDGNGDAVVYRDASIPLAASEDGVVGFGATLVDDSAEFQSGNEEFLLNVWDAEIGEGTVLYDVGHDQDTTFANVSNFVRYAGKHGYTVEESDEFITELGRADAVWITSPGTSFTDRELRALGRFVDDGGVVLLHGRGDYQGEDHTTIINDVAAGLDLSFRFNDDQVMDATNHGGRYHSPLTSQFNDRFDYFDDREGLDIDPDTSHIVDVVRVPDGDTATVEFDSGRQENVRLLGIDTPEKSRNSQHERSQEWEGITDRTYLERWAKKASEFGRDRLAGERVELKFASSEDGIFDKWGRLLGFLRYDPTGDGRRDTLYNYEGVSQGYARVYASRFEDYERFYQAEATAQAEGRGLWGGSDPASVSQIRNRPVEEVFVPKAAAVATERGELDRSRAPVYAESAASAEGTYSWADQVPLVGVDEAASVAALNSGMIDESYERAEDFEVDTAGYENFVLVANLIDHLADGDGKILIEGGHGQFVAEWSVACEDTAYLQRFLEGVGVDFDQINDVTLDRLSEARALVVSSPASGFTAAEKRAIERFRDDGGAVVLLGSAAATEAATRNLNDLAAALDTDLRVDGAVTDSVNNVNGDEAIPTTAQFNDEFPLFSAVGESPSDPDTGFGEDGQVSGTLSEGGQDVYTYDLDAPSSLDVELSGDPGTDFDLYVTLDGRTPATTDYDRRSYTYGTDEEISIDSEVEDELGMLVDGYSGSGEYTMTVTETDGDGGDGGGGGDDGDDGDDGSNDDCAWYEFWCWMS